MSDEGEGILRGEFVRQQNKAVRVSVVVIMGRVDFVNDGGLDSPLSAQMSCHQADKVADKVAECSR